MENNNNNNHDEDPVEGAIQYAHIVIPCAGAVMIFLMAFIAITMA